MAVVRSTRGTRGRGGTPRVTPSPSGRYTPPTPKAHKASSRWLLVVMLALLVGGMVVIVANYLGLLPGDAKNGYLFLGLGLITVGFLVATRYR
jgi:hypothetical protein